MPLGRQLSGHSRADVTLLHLGAVNRVGHEKLTGEGLEFWGRSFVSDPFGRLLQVGDTAREEIITITCSRKWMEDIRRNWPFFRDRRIDHYAGITKRVAD